MRRAAADLSACRCTRGVTSRRVWLGVSLVGLALSFLFFPFPPLLCQLVECPVKVMRCMTERGGLGLMAL